MSSSFSFTRLGKLITKQFYENARFYTFSLLALAGLLALTFAFWLGTSRPNYHEEVTYFIFLFGLFITGTVFASLSFNMLGSRDKGVYWLGVPATHLEKLVCIIFYTTIVYFVLYCLCFLIIKSLAVIIIKQLIKENPSYTYIEVDGFNEGFGKVVPYFICGFFAVQALYLLGSVYFSRYTFVVTTVIGAILFFAFGFYLTVIHNKMFDNNISWDIVDAKKYNIGIRNSYYLYSISPTLVNILKYIVQFACAPLFWVVTWYRLKEKEI